MKHLQVFQQATQQKFKYKELGFFFCTVVRHIVRESCASHSPRELREREGIDRYVATTSSLVDTRKKVKVKEGKKKPFARHDDHYD